MILLRPRALRPALLAAALALAGCGGADDGIDSRVVRLDASLESTPCPPALQDPTARCGWLRVRQDAKDPAAGHLRLPFAILPARSTAPSPYPVLLYGGGPGPSVLASVAQLDAAQLRDFPLRQNRDLLLLDARGADGLRCPELEENPAQPRFTTLERTLAAVQACADRVRGAGSRLRQHHSAAMADDAAVFKLLLGAERGYRAWNLVGTSYGTRVLLQELGQGTGGVRSVVLDGPMSPATRLLNEVPLLEALDAVLARCNADAVCAQAYPGLRNRFAAALETLQTQPRRLADGRLIDAERVLEALRGQLAAGAAVAAPLLMHWVAEGQIELAADAFGMTDAYRFVPNPSLLYYAAICQDDAVAVQLSGTAPRYGSAWSSRLRQAAADADAGLTRAICQQLAPQLALPALPMALRPAVPTLLSVGEFDPLTPRRGASALASNWPQAREVVLDREGHGLLEGNACALAEIQRFLDAPNSYQPGACARARNAEPFLVLTP